MEFEKCKIEGLVLCKPKLINDSRGFFSEVFRKDLLENTIKQKINFCQSNTSESKYGTIRGLHFQSSPSSQTKLVSVSKGEILDVALILEPPLVLMVSFTLLYLMIRTIFNCLYLKALLTDSLC